MPPVLPSVFRAVTAAQGAPVYGAAARAEWPLDPAVAYLNHGGYGVAPNAVLAAQADWRRRIEADPMRFMTRELPAAWRAAAATLAAHLGARGDDVVFVANATAGCNAVLRSLDFRARRRDPCHQPRLSARSPRRCAMSPRVAAPAWSRRRSRCRSPTRRRSCAAVAARLGPRTRLAVLRSRRVGQRAGAAGGRTDAAGTGSRARAC